MLYCVFSSVLGQQVFLKSLQYLKVIKLKQTEYKNLNRLKVANVSNNLGATIITCCLHL